MRTGGVFASASAGLQGGRHGYNFPRTKCMKQSAFYNRRLIAALTTVSAYCSKNCHSHEL